MPLWKVTHQNEGGETQTRVVNAARRGQVESYVLQDFTIERVRRPEEMLELRDIEIEQVK